MMDDAKIKTLVDRFLAWPLPKSVLCDGCVVMRDYPHSRSGTNLLTADEARQMVEYLFASERPGLPLFRLKEKINLRLNNRLCEIEQGLDDSVVGFNEAWNIVRAAFAEACGADILPIAGSDGIRMEDIADETDISPGNYRPSTGLGKTQ